MNNLIYHFRVDLTPLLSPDLQISFENFIIYLEKWYFSERSIFKKNDWNYHLKLVDILLNSQNKNKINSTTNAIESINLQLKRSCSYGKINFSAASEILVDFKSSYRSLFEEKVLRLNLNRRKPQALENNRLKCQILTEYLRLDSSEKNIYALQYLFKFGLKNPLAFYSTWVVNENEPEDDLLNFTLI